MQNDMREFCLNKDTCLRKLLLKSHDYEQTVLVKPIYTIVVVSVRDNVVALCAWMNF